MSDLFQSSLFLGFLIPEDFRAHLNALDPEFKALFIQQGNDAYLSEFKKGHDCFLGKFIGQKIKISRLNELSLNIISLLQKLVSGYPYQELELVVIPIALED